MDSDAKTTRPLLRFRFVNWFWLILIIAITLCWWLDHARLRHATKLLELRLQRLQDQVRMGMDSAATRTQIAALSPTDFVSLVRGSGGWYELQNAYKPFRESDERHLAVPDLIALLSDADATVRTRALSALAMINSSPKRVVPAAAKLLNDPSTNVQWHAANVLAEYPQEARPFLDRLQSMMMDDECEVATFAALTVHQIDPALDIADRLIRLSKSPIRENRWRAVFHLAEHVDEETLKTVLEKRFETEKDEEIRNIIADTLNRI